jgi:hypothetical protein
MLATLSELVLDREGMAADRPKAGHEITVRHCIAFTVTRVLFVYISIRPLDRFCERPVLQLVQVCANARFRKGPIGAKARRETCCRQEEVCAQVVRLEN